MVTRECMECRRDFEWKGGSFKCSDECRDTYVVRRNELYNAYRRKTYRLKKRYDRGELTREVYDSLVRNAYRSYLEDRDGPAEGDIDVRTVMMGGDAAAFPLFFLSLKRQRVSRLRSRHPLSSYSSA